MVDLLSQRIHPGLDGLPPRNALFPEVVRQQLPCRGAGGKRSRALGHAGC